MLNPCCCISPRIGAFVLAVADVALTALYAWGVIVTILNRGLQGEMLGELLLATALLCMAVLLLVGVWKGNAEKVRLWLIVWIICILLCIVFQVFNVYQYGGLQPRTGGSLPALLLFIYQIWVVYAYLHELRCGPAGLTYCPTQITV